ncbi:MAG: hypothetical protein AB7L91_17045 [Dehalococcoidia bacterium]
MSMNAARLLRHRRGYGLLAVAALLALLQPAFSPVFPQIAGWLPGHQHVYVNGVPVNHAHPWDDLSQRVRAATEPAAPAFVVHLCDLHPDGRVPVGPPTAANVGGDAETDTNEVAFTFDLGVTSVVLPSPNANVTPHRGESVLTPEDVACPVVGPGDHPVPPPPRA